MPELLTPGGRALKNELFHPVFWVNSSFPPVWPVGPGPSPEQLPRHTWNQVCGRRWRRHGPGSPEHSPGRMAQMRTADAYVKRSCSCNTRPGRPSAAPWQAPHSLLDPSLITALDWTRTLSQHPSCGQQGPDWSPSTVEVSSPLGLISQLCSRAGLEAWRARAGAAPGCTLSPGAGLSLPHLTSDLLGCRNKLFSGHP